MKEATIGGFVMAKVYTHICQHEKEILEMKKEGFTYKEIGERLGGYTRKQVKKFVERYNKKKRELAKGKPVRRRGRPSKHEGELPPSIQKLDKLSQMRYVIASKDRYIKQLEMELELMRDFLLLTERK